MTVLTSPLNLFVKERIQGPLESLFDSPSGGEQGSCFARPTTSQPRG